MAIINEPDGKRVRITQEDNPTGYTHRDIAGNPLGLPLKTPEYSTGTPRDFLRSNTLGNNSTDAAINYTLINRVLSNCPDTGVGVDLPDDLVISDPAILPIRRLEVLGSIYNDQIINCEIRGTHPFVQLLCNSPNPAVQSWVTTLGGNTTLYPGKQSLHSLRNLRILSRGIGVMVNTGRFFHADQVVVVAQGSTGWHFENCYAMDLGRVIAAHCAGDGFTFIASNYVTGKLTAQACNGRGVVIGDGITWISSYFISVDGEGNNGYQIEAKRLQESFLTTYSEGPPTNKKRIKLTECRDVRFEGTNIIEADEYSRIHCNLYRVETPFTNVVNPYHSGSYGTFAALSATRWTLIKDTPTAGWVDVAPSFPAYSTPLAHYILKFRVKGTIPNNGQRLGTLKISCNGTVPTHAVQDCLPSENWTYYTMHEQMLDSTSRIFFYADPDANLEFEMLYIARMT